MMIDVQMKAKNGQVQIYRTPPLFLNGVGKEGIKTEELLYSFKTNIWVKEISNEIKCNSPQLKLTVLPSIAWRKLHTAGTSSVFLNEKSVQMQ